MLHIDGVFKRPFLEDVLIGSLKDHCLNCHSTLFPMEMGKFLLSVAPYDFPSKTAVFTGLSYTLMSGLQNVEQIQK